MRKYALLLAVCIIPVLADAETVPVSKARFIAERFLGVEPATKSANGLQLTQVNDEMYLFSRPSGGFIFLSADDAATPVLGYSYDSRIDMDNLPEGLKMLLDSYSSQIRDIRSRGLKPSVEIRREWDRLTTVTKGGDDISYEPSIYYTTALWGSTYPYNVLFPVFNDVHSYASNVLIATAILMRYYRFPEAGVGTVPAYTSSIDGFVAEMPENQLGRKYNWDIMPLHNYETDRTGQSYTNEEIDELSHLYYDIGTALHTDFGYYSSSHPTFEETIRVLTENFLYSPEMVLEDRALYFDTDWISLMKKNLNDAGPILYSMQGSSGWHFCVLAGYDEKDRLYFNWGWNGGGNGFFALNSLNPYGYSLNDHHWAIVNVRPGNFAPKEGDLESITSVDYDTYLNLLTVTTGMKVKFTLTDSNGKPELYNISKEGRNIVIYAENLYPDEYTLTLEAPDGQTKTIVFEIGRKTK